MLQRATKPSSRSLALSVDERLLNTKTPLSVEKRTYLLDPRKDDLSEKDILRSMNNSLMRWTSGEDIVVTDLIGRGGNGFVFKCLIRRVPPGLSGKRGTCSFGDLVWRSRHPVVKMISSEGVRDRNFQKESRWEFYISKVMQEAGYGPPVYCWGAFTLKGTRNSAYPCPPRYKSEKGGCDDPDVGKDVMYFLIFMEEMRSSLDRYTGIGRSSDARRAWADATRILQDASLRGRYVFVDVKPENFLIKTAEHNRSSRLERVYISDFDKQYLFVVESGDVALLLNMILFSTSALFHSHNFADKYRVEDGLFALLPDSLLLFMSDMCSFYCVSPKTVAFLVAGRPYMRAALRYSHTCERVDDASRPDYPGIMRRFLESYRRRVGKHFDTSSSARARLVRRERLNRVADSTFLGAERSEKYGTIDFGKQAACRADATPDTPTSSPRGCRDGSDSTGG